MFGRAAEWNPSRACEVSTETIQMLGVDIVRRGSQLSRTDFKDMNGRSGGTDWIPHVSERLSLMELAAVSGAPPPLQFGSL